MKNSEYKEIIDKIVKEEKEEHNLDFDIHFIGKLTYFKKMNEIKKKKVALDERIVEMIVLKNCDAFQCKDDNAQVIVIFSNCFKKKLFKTKITKLVRTLYHEIHHVIDTKVEKVDIINYDNLIWTCDYLFVPQTSKYYFDIITHDSMCDEIFADRYAVEKTRQFFEKNKQYKLDEKYLQLQNNYVQQRYNSFDLSKRLDIIINNYIAPQFNNDLFNIFLNSDGSYKNLDEIRSHVKFNTLDNRIIKGFLNTKAFKDSLDLTKISDDSKQYLLNLYDINPETSKKLTVQNHRKYYEVNLSNAINNFSLIIESIILTYMTIKCLENPQHQSGISILLSGLILANSTLLRNLLLPLIRRIREKYKINVEEKEMLQLINELKRSIDSNEVKKI